MEDGKTVQISSDRVVEEERGLFSRVLTPDISGGWNATDHVFLTIPSLSRMRIIQAHPFTIASRASHDPKSCLRLLIRAQDGFSKDLLRYAKGHDSVPLWGAVPGQVLASQ
jgi:predicted ferric reductase